MKTSFSGLHFENMVEFLKVKTTKCTASIKTWTPVAPHFYTYPHWMFNYTLKLPFKYSYHFMAPGVSAPGKHTFLLGMTLRMCLSSQISSWFLCNISCLNHPKKFIHFQFVQIFPVFGVILLGFFVVGFHWKFWIRGFRVSWLVGIYCEFILLNAYYFCIL